MENTAKIVILGAAAVLVSGVKLEDWKLVEKYAPEALKRMDEDGEPCFRVMACKGSGSATKYGICWGTYISDEGNATVTVLIDESVDDKKAAVMDIMGSALINLMDIEKEIPGVIAGIREKQVSLESHISVV